MSFKFSLTDDDGVLVVSTVRQMEFWKDHDFGYEFPEEVIRQMREGRAVAWQCDGEDECDLELCFSRAQPVSEKSRLGPFRLKVLEGDQFVIMPYSQFTFAADCASGEVEDIDGLSFKTPIEAGIHHVYITITGEAEWLLNVVPEDGTPLLDFGDALPFYR